MAEMFFYIHCQIAFIGCFLRFYSYRDYQYGYRAKCNKKERERLSINSCHRSTLKQNETGDMRPWKNEYHLCIVFFVTHRIWLACERVRDDMFLMRWSIIYDCQALWFFSLFTIVHRSIYVRVHRSMLLLFSSPSFTLNVHHESRCVCTQQPTNIHPIMRLTNNCNKKSFWPFFFQRLHYITFCTRTKRMESEWERETML